MLLPHMTQYKDLGNVALPGALANLTIAGNTAK